MQDQEKDRISRILRNKKEEPIHGAAGIPGPETTQKNINTLPEVSPERGAAELALPELVKRSVVGACACDE